MELTDDDVRRTLCRALWMTGALTLVATPVIWAVWGWRSWVLFLVGAAISGTGIYEWLQLMAAMVARMEVSAEGVPPAPKPLGPVLAWFFLRMGLAVVLLYVSLKSLNGSIYALLGGLALSLVALLIEAMRLLTHWRS
ncbi:MAG TPA: hypothetical protein VMU62_09775 [Acidobacteriaceae bacterium]|nr:hypothetical protein [Acidobacteriaceae bacterium]